MAVRLSVQFAIRNPKFAMTGGVPWHPKNQKWRYGWPHDPRPGRDCGRRSFFGRVSAYRRCLQSEHHGSHRIGAGTARYAGAPAGARRQTDQAFCHRRVEGVFEGAVHRLPRSGGPRQRPGRGQPEVARRGPAHRLLVVDRDALGHEGFALSAKLWNWARGQGPGIFTDVNLMAQRKPSELFQAVMDGHGEMPSYRGKLTDDEVWAVVNYVWTFVYQYPAK